MSDTTAADTIDAETVDAITRAAAAAQARPKLVEAEPDELDYDSPPVFVSNGWIRTTIAGQACKMRRPSLGEMQELEALLDTHRHELMDMQDQMQEEIAADVIRAKEIETEARSLNGEDSERKRVLDDEATRLAVKAMERSESVTRQAARLRAEWWKHAFEVLTPRGFKPPTDMPAWVKDGVLQNRVVQHWQSVPLALGNE